MELRGHDEVALRGHFALQLHELGQGLRGGDLLQNCFRGFLLESEMEAIHKSHCGFGAHELLKAHSGRSVEANHRVVAVDGRSVLGEEQQARGAHHGAGFVDNARGFDEWVHLGQHVQQIRGHHAQAVLLAERLGEHQRLANRGAVGGVEHVGAGVAVHASCQPANERLEEDSIVVHKRTPNLHLNLALAQLPSWMRAA
eukprot:CAMPEP_0114227042 /NCGR_PEP_ID=MMETSP0058-20121206/1568_1 /TAXON_ID=36894 /ORGANISM="Pyramimonas parkeae, CCMP726" /LENGTH=198 /DNA_ID=CAMNT_0001337835 /DNA_START=210 /DNA_END=806 /DNA_ORIENTATION=-